MSDPVWYRSLYWRIALGFVLCLTGLLITQALLFLWLAERNAASMLARSPQHLAAVVASDLSDAVEADEHADLPRMLREQYADRPDRILVVMRDGRTFQNVTDTPPPDWALRAALYRLRYDRFNDSDVAAARDANPNDARDARGSRDSRGGGGGGGGPLSRRLPASPIQVKGVTTGLVLVIPARRPPFPLLQEFGPTLAIAGLVLLVAGTAMMAFFVFQPARRRLRKLEAAAEAIGAGDTSVRAPEDGGDEVAELAKVFNRMAADLDARVRELQEVDRARRQLLADVSHELMTPLTAIRGYLETLALPIAANDPEARERYLDIVTEETLRLEAIIGDLLDLARLEGGGAALQRDAVSVQMLFDRAAERHGPTLRERQVMLRMHIEPGADVVEGDARRLEQAIQNLVANAVRHVGEGGEIALTASPADAEAADAARAAQTAHAVQAAQAAQAIQTAQAAHAVGAGATDVVRAANVDKHRRVRLRIDDNGPGIPPEHLPRIFDRFYRVDAARDQASGGSGLGLSIVRAIIEAHGGTVTATTSPTGGARFEILLNKPR